MTEIDLPADKTLLLVDDDKPFLTRLARAMETRGFEVRMAESVAEGIQQVKKSAPGYAVVDLRLGDGNGLDVIEALHASRPEARVVVLTGYGVDQESEKGRHEGMGLGFFIAKTLLERSGATVSLANRPLPEHGAVIQLSWPRSAVDLGNP